MQAGAVACACKRPRRPRRWQRAACTTSSSANEVIAPHKLQRVASWPAHSTRAAAGWRLRSTACRGAGTGAAMGHESALIDVFIELDVGQNRCGVAQPQDVGRWRRKSATSAHCALPACRPTTAGPAPAQRGRAPRRARRGSGTRQADAHAAGRRRPAPAAGHRRRQRHLRAGSEQRGLW